MEQKKSSKFTFARINPNNNTKFDWSEKKDKEYIKFGEDNLFPQKTIELYNNSSIHAACVNAIVEGIVGEGLTANEESYIGVCNSDGETWNNVFEKVAMDFKLHGAFALEVIYSQDRERIAEVYHIDFSYLRAVEKNHRGKIPGYYISTDWKNKFRYSITSDEDIQYLPVYNPELKEAQPSQIFVSNHWRPGAEYYPLADYVAAYRIIELDIEVDNFHVMNLKNGLVPSLAITTFTNGSDTEKREIQNQLEAAYGGTDNAGSLIYMDVSDVSMKPDIQPIQTTGTDEYYTTINDLVMQKVLTAHRITSPLLLGIQQPGSLGNRDEMIDANLLFHHNVIQPLQQDILTDLEKIMKFNFPDIVLGVQTTKLYEDGSEEVDVVTDTDTSNTEDANIQQPEILS